MAAQLEIHNSKLHLSDLIWVVSQRVGDESAC